MKLIKIKIVLLFLSLTLGNGCTQKKTAKVPKDVEVPISTYLKNAMHRYNIPGLALAVVQGDTVVYKKYFGNASLSDDIRVKDNTLFRIFSTTKLITATAVFQLMEDGKLHLEDRITDQLSELPEHWDKVKVKNLLSHSSGLPDMVRFDQNLSDAELLSHLSRTTMDFDTGSHFGYNQTNYWLLAKIIEKHTKIPFEKFVIQQQFPEVTDGFLFSSNSQAQIPNRAIRYFFNPKTKAFEMDTNNNGKRGHSGNGANINLEAFIAWNQRLDANKLIAKETKARMWTPFSFSNAKDEFLHGWGVYRVNGEVSYGFTGGNLSAFRKFPEHDITIILLSNGYQIPAYDIIVNDIARLAIPEISTKLPILEDSVMQYLLDGKLEEALRMYHALKSENDQTSFDNLKSNVNTLGNHLSSEGSQEKAFRIFKWNADAHPDWWIAIAGLAEAYQAMDENEKAMYYYEEAIRLNNANEYGYNEIMRKEIDHIKTEILNWT